MLKNKILPSLLAITITLIIGACNSEPTVTLSTGVSVQNANDMMQQNNNIVVLDVRTPKEFAKGHIAGAVNINIHDPAFTQQVSTLDRDKLYIVHCAVNPRGGRGDKSIHIMSDLGFSNLLSMDGGLNAWKRAKFPINNS